MNNCVNYVLTTPWPSFGPQKPDPMAIANLYRFYAGRDSELTGITQYMYNSLLLANQGEQELSELFACVSQTEMHHWETFGQLLLAYGADPKLYAPQNGRWHWWNGGMLPYDRAPEPMLRKAIADEKGAAAAYELAASKMAPEPAAVLRRIALDEKHHAELFEAALARITAPAAKIPPTSRRPRK